MSGADAMNAAMAADSRTAMRSCSTCAKAKAKCVRQLGRATCERCARLNKECHTREVTHRKRRQMKLTRSEQLEKLENKIESLVNAFSNQTALQAGADQLSPPESQQGSEKSADRTYLPPKDGQHRADKGLEIMETVCRFGDEGLRQRPDPTNEDPTTFLEAKIIGDQLGQNLDRYRRLMADGCPFVKIPEDTTYLQIYQQRPMLMMAISVVASFHSHSKQQDLAKDFMRCIIERIMFKSEKSIDILQALLIFITWNHPHFFWAHQLTNLLHLAIAQAVDLSIDRWPHAFDRQKFETAAQKAVNGSSVGMQKSTLEERRAVLGIFYLTSLLSSTFRKVDAVKWSSWHDECLKVLEVAQEYESDRVLVAMVKLQVLVDDISPMDSSSVPAHTYVKLYQRDMERLKATSPESRTNMHLRMQFVAAEIFAWESLYADLFEAKKTSRVLQKHHAEGIYKLIEAVKKNLGFFCSIPTDTYLTLPFQTFVTFAQAFMSMLRLSFLEADGWDLRAFREHIDIQELIERGAKSYEEATKAVIDGIPVDNDCFARWAAKLRWSGQLYAQKCGNDESLMSKPTDATTNGSSFTQASPAPGPQQPTPTDDAMNGTIPLYWDDAFWSNFNTDFDFGMSDFNMT